MATICFRKWRCRWDNKGKEITTEAEGQVLPRYYTILSFSTALKFTII